MEQIYTIPVNEAFEASAADKSCGCPICALYNKLEEDELDLILGASMMEPDVRIKTNEMGFCQKHFEMMLTRKNRLGLALMLESHLAQVSKEANGFGALKKIGKMNDSCYICSRIEYHIDRMFETAVWLYETDRAFERKMENQQYFCLPHYQKFLEVAKDNLKRSKYADFERLVSRINNTYLTEVTADVSWFCKKFDYRYDEEPWGNAKDSIERSVKFLVGEN